MLGGTDIIVERKLAMNEIVILPGRFEPPHLGHRASYNQLQKTFPNAKVFIATSGITAPVTHPFKFEDKVNLFNKLGVPPMNVVQCASPYRATEITNQVVDPENTILIFAVSAKDMAGENARFRFGTKKDGTPSYMQPYPGTTKKCKPMTQHAYVYTTEVATFKVMGKDANSATAIRNAYIEGNEHDRNRIIHDLYGHTDKAIEDLFNKRLLATKETYAYAQALKDNPNKAIDRISESRIKNKMVRLMETILQLESEAKQAYQPLNEDLVPDYLEERSK
jgi:FAD synthase